MSLRRKDFPTWSWAAWKGSPDVKLRFIKAKPEGASQFDLEWHYHQHNKDRKYVLALVTAPEL
jgi:hypothetical protein